MSPRLRGGPNPGVGLQQLIQLEGDMPAATAQVLSEWRRAERLLHVVPPDAPERTELDAAVDRLRRMYLALTNGAIAETTARLASAQETIGASKDLLDAIDARYGPDRAADPEPA